MSGRFSNSNHQAKASSFHSRQNTGFSNARLPGYSYQARFSSPNFERTHNQQERPFQPRFPQSDNFSQCNPDLSISPNNQNLNSFSNSNNFASPGFRTIPFVDNFSKSADNKSEYLPTFDNTTTISQEISQFPSPRPRLKSFIAKFNSDRGFTTITSVRPVRPKNLNQPHAAFEQYQLNSWATSPPASFASSGVPANPLLPEPSAQLLAPIPSNTNSDKAYRGANETLESGIQSGSNLNPWLYNATFHEPSVSATLSAEPVLKPEPNRVPFVENNMHPFGSDSFTPPMGHSTEPQFSRQGARFSAPVRFPIEAPPSAFEPPINAGESYQNAAPNPLFQPPPLPPPPLECPPQQLPPPSLPAPPPPPQPQRPFDHRSSEDFIYSEPSFTIQPPFTAAGTPHSLTGECGEPSFGMRRGPPAFIVNDIAAPPPAHSDSQIGFHDSSRFQYRPPPHEPQPVPPPSFQARGPPVPRFQTPLPPNPPANPYRDTFQPRQPCLYGGAPAFHRDERNKVDQSWYSQWPMPIGHTAPPPLGPEPESKRVRFAAEEAAARFLAPNPNPGSSPFRPDRVRPLSPPAPVQRPMPIPMPLVDFEAAAPRVPFRARALQLEEYGAANFGGEGEKQRGY